MKKKLTIEQFETCFDSVIAEDDNKKLFVITSIDCYGNIDTTFSITHKHLDLRIESGDAGVIIEYYNKLI